MGRRMIIKSGKREKLRASMVCVRYANSIKPINPVSPPRTEVLRYFFVNAGSCLCFNSMTILGITKRSNIAKKKLLADLIASVIEGRLPVII
jgi:hypothetical protein